MICGMINNMKNNKMARLIALTKRRGFIYQGSEIYGGLSGTWDYGPLGLELKRQVMNAWWKHFVEDRDDMYGVDAAILMNQKVWQASGHVDTFTDPLVECSNCKARFRADHVDNDQCPNCKTKNPFGEPRLFNMMFKTHVGPVNDESSLSYLRPETAQGIFTNYHNIVDNFYPDLPFGIAQVGKAFRNEISPRDFVFRSREFEQMEIEYFVHPNRWEEAFEELRQSIHQFLTIVGLDKKFVHEFEVPPEELAHYSKRTIDFEFDYPTGRAELLGLAYRTDFDLQNIARVSGKSMDYVIKGTNQKLVPHVVEPSFGVERLIMAILAQSYRKDEIDGEEREYLALPENMAPMRYCVSPLLKNKPELVEKAREVYKSMKEKYIRVMWDDNANIGKRYRRQDEIGTPKCIVIDFETLDNDTVTVRDRDTTQQVRVALSDLI